MHSASFGPILGPITTLTSLANFKARMVSAQASASRAAEHVSSMSEAESADLGAGVTPPALSPVLGCCTAERAVQDSSHEALQGISTMERVQEPTDAASSEDRLVQDRPESNDDQKKEPQQYSGALQLEEDQCTCNVECLQIAASAVYQPQDFASVAETESNPQLNSGSLTETGASRVVLPNHYDTGNSSGDGRLSESESHTNPQEKALEQCTAASQGQPGGQTQGSSPCDVPKQSTAALAAETSLIGRRQDRELPGLEQPTTAETGEVHGSVGGSFRGGPQHAASWDAQDITAAVKAISIFLERAGLATHVQLMRTSLERSEEQRSGLGSNTDCQMEGQVSRERTSSESGQLPPSQEIFLSCGRVLRISLTDAVL